MSASDLSPEPTGSGAPGQGPAPVPDGPTPDTASGGARRSGIPGGSTMAVTRTMPGDFDIAIEPGTGQVKPGAVAGARRQPMRGYDETYTDIVDYCVRVTERIWHDHDVGYIYDTYAEGCRVHDDQGWKYGVERVVQNTMQAINAFPDLKLYADDVIWAGDETQGFVTSHRAMDVGHHTGPWRWGEPTNKPIRLWVLANCVSKENRFYEEWVLYNTAGQLLQLGIDLRSAARRAAEEDVSGNLTDHQLGEVDRLLSGRVPRPYDRPAGTRFDVDHATRALFHDVFNRRDLSAIERGYAPNVQWHGATNREGRGRSVVKSMARNLLSTFPDLALQVDEVYWMGNDHDGYSVSARWSAGGTHRGYGLYGAPTGRRVFLWGISQLYFQDGQIVEDWMLFNEFDVLAQLLGPEGTALG